MLLAGEIGKPHGLAGEVYVIVISDDPRRFEPGSCLTHGDGRELLVESARRHGNRVVVKFEGIDTRPDAEGLRGPVFVGEEEARALEPDEFWSYELVGCTAVLPGGTAVGEVVRVDPGAAHDLIAIATERGERLVPAVKAIVVDVDVRARRITVDPPAGLLD